jgi:hypothetical protein
MATLRKALLFDNSTDANFRSWGSGISTAIASLGMVQTADTGQINWASVTAPAQNVFAGYEIWKNSNDSAFATLPIFFKIEYGTSNAVNGGPNVRVQCGTGSNGSGTLTGTSAPAVPLFQTNSGTLNKGSSTFLNCYFSGDGAGARFGMMLWVDDLSGAGGNCCWGFERSLSNTGLLYTSQYFTWIVGSHGFSTPVWQQNSIFVSGSAYGSGTPSTTIKGLATVACDNATTYSYNGRGFPILPVFPMVGYLGNPLTIFVGVPPTDVAATTASNFASKQTTTQLYGQSMTFLVIKSNPFNTLAAKTNAGGMRYD